jgi:CheY-like chemotaxis protein
MIRDLIKQKLLVVEDNEAARILIKEILGNINVTIIETGCAEEAICLFKKFNHEIVLVLLDMRLPNWDGCELLKQLRNINPLVPAISMSALTPIELAVKPNSFNRSR